jgi:hypothetical protein
LEIGETLRRAQRPSCRRKNSLCNSNFCAGHYGSILTR